MSKLSEFINYVEQRSDDDSQLSEAARGILAALSHEFIPANKAEAAREYEWMRKLSSMLKLAASAASAMEELRENQLREEMIANDEQSFTSASLGRTFFLTEKTYVASGIRDLDGKRSYNADDLIAWLKENGGDHLAKRTVNAQSFGAFVRELMLHPDSTKQNPIYDESLLPAGWERFVEVSRVPSVGTRK